jgi:ankyrin repeat protein
MPDRERDSLREGEIMRVLPATFVAAAVIVAGCATQWTAADQHLLDGLKATDAGRVQAALAQGAKANIEYADGMTPLAVAVARNDQASAEALLRVGADPNIAVNVGSPGGPAQSLLSLAEDVAMAKVLVKGGADPNRRDNGGETPLGRAVLQGNAELVKALLEVGANAESPLASGQRPLWFAVSMGNVAVVSALLAGGADPNREDAEGRMVLHAAAANPSAATVVVLLNAKANPDCRDKAGITPLMVAAEEGFVGPARVLLDAGADPNVHNSAGMTALDLANAKNQTQVVRLLEEGGGKATRDVAEARESLRAAAGRDALRIFTTDLTTDGRNIKIRGRVENPHSETVRGIRYRVVLMHRDTKRVLDEFFEEDEETELAPGESSALRLDIASMYAATQGSFQVEAVPIRLNEREIPNPPQWRQ